MTEHRIELPDPFPPGARKLAFLDGRQVLVCNVEGTLVAFDNACPHAGGSLYSGKLDGRWLRCPSHGLRFDLLNTQGGGADLVRHAIRRCEGGALIDIPVN